MNRKTFFTAIATVIAAPFTQSKKEPEPPHQLPRDRPVTPSDVEELVRKEIIRLKRIN